MFTGIVSGVAPAFQSSRTGLTRSLKLAAAARLRSGARVRALAGHQRTSAFGAAGQLRGLLIRSLWSLSHGDPGFRPENVLTARITPNESFCSDPGRCFSFYRELVGAFDRSPDQHAALVSTLPLGGGSTSGPSIWKTIRAWFAGKSAPLLWMNASLARIFQRHAHPVLRGREFTEGGHPVSSHMVIVSAETARRFWPDWTPSENTSASRTERLVHGHRRCGRRARPGFGQNVPEWMHGFVYVPYGPGATLENGTVPAEMTLFIRSASAAPQLEQSLRGLASSLNPEAPVGEVKPMSAILSGAASAPRSIASLFAAFAGLALILGIIGIYGVISFFVGQRTREFAVRIALGAQRRDILKLVVNEGLSLTLTGILAGLASAFVLTRFLGTLLYGVSATDPLDFAAVSVLFAFVALAACYVPARRAMRVDAIDALRNE